MGQIFGYLVLSGDIFGIQWVEARETAIDITVRKAGSPTQQKNCPAQNIHSTELEKTCFSILDSLGQVIAFFDVVDISVLICKIRTVIKIASFYHLTRLTTKLGNRSKCLEIQWLQNGGIISLSLIHVCCFMSHFIGVYPLILLLDLGSQMLLQFVTMTSIFDLVKLIKQGGHQTGMALMPDSLHKQTKTQACICLKVMKLKPKDINHKQPTRL